MDPNDALDNATPAQHRRLIDLLQQYRLSSAMSNHHGTERDPLHTTVLHLTEDVGMPVEDVVDYMTGGPSPIAGRYEITHTL